MRGRQERMLDLVHELHQIAELAQGLAAMPGLSDAERDVAREIAREAREMFENKQGQLAALLAGAPGGMEQ